jgi:hypothetical protein
MTAGRLLVAQPCRDFMAKNASAFLPANAEWENDVPTCQWKCKFKYDLNPIATLCCKRIRDAVPLLPSNAEWSADSCNFTCKSGYFGATCKLCGDYSRNQFTQEEINFQGNFVPETSAFFLPPFAEWVDFAANCSWQCMRAYTLNPIKNRCCSTKNFSWPVPESIDWLNECDWQCKAGTFGPRCEICSEYQGQKGLAVLRSTLKGVFPDKAIYLDGKDRCDWDCMSGFVKMNGTCQRFYDASYCRQQLKCFSCVASDICGWCASTGQCLPGNAHGMVGYHAGNASSPGDSCPANADGTTAWNYDGCPSFGGNGGMTAAKLQEILERLLLRLPPPTCSFLCHAIAASACFRLS